ncbi:MAG: hypothetical protein NT018_09150 [Armatimonadetes bacterium]|nr:hypothetical protein [Armatimonadota bacterium]
MRWSLYSSDSVDTELQEAIAVAEHAMGAVLETLELPDDGDSDTTRAYIALRKVEASYDVRQLRDLFEYDGVTSAESAAELLIELCALRNECARRCWYNSYPAMALTAQCIPSTSGYAHAVLRYLGEPRRIDAKEYLSIECFDKYWAGVEARLNSVAVCGVVRDRDYVDFIAAMLGSLKLECLSSSIDIVVKDQPYASGICFDLSTDVGIRRAGILLRPTGIRSFFVAAHELGHAVLCLQHGGGLTNIPSWFDESNAYLVEDNQPDVRAALRELFDDNAVSSWLAIHSELREIEYCRIYASILLEDAIWAMADRRDISVREKVELISEMCREIYSTYLNTCYRDAREWAFDSFRSIDPVYVHSYGIGRNAAAILRSCRCRPGQLGPYDVSREALDAILAKTTR